MRSRFAVPNLVGGVAVLIAAAAVPGQDRHTALSPADVQRLEGVLKIDPTDRAARKELLYYYFRAPVEPAVAIPARRRHILWVIENSPDEDLAYGPTTTIDRSGHSLADPQGFRLASNAWRAQAERPDAKAMTLANAAYFFKMDDKLYAVSLLKRALALDSMNKEMGARLGDEYALIILGVTMVNGSGYPVRNDPNLCRSADAGQAREDITNSRNPYVLAKAGYQLLWQGDVLYYSGRLPFDPEPLAKSALDRAVGLAPGDQGVASLRGEYDRIRAARSPQR